MASLLKEPLFEISAQGPAPNKDFYQLSITKSDVIWRYWKISLRNASRNAKPGEQRESHQDYLEDTRLQSQVGLVFGQGVQAYTLALGRGCYDYLERLPDALLLRILAHLQLEEVGALGQTSHRFRKLCSSEAFWEQAVRGHWETVPDEVGSLGLELGWRRVFFTSKLQLQKLISRQRQQLREEEEEEEEEGGLITEASGTPEAFWDSAGSSGTVLSSGTGDSAYTESLSDSDTLSNPHSPRESGSGSGVVDTWPKEGGVDM